MMMNDIPEPANDVKLSLYADESAIWRAGPNPEVNRRHLQSHLDRLKKFFDEWGFKVSTTKTVAAEFRLSGTPTAHLPLKLGTSRLLYKSSVKLLGVIFDRHLTWSEHIKYVADRCKKRLNLMRAMAGSHLGASKDTLLMVYRALIAPSATTAASPTRAPRRTRRKCLTQSSVRHSPRFWSDSKNQPGCSAGRLWRDTTPNTPEAADDGVHHEGGRLTGPPGADYHRRTEAESGQR